MDPFFAKEEKVVRFLYRNVSNTAEVRKLILTARLPLCLLKSKLIVDDFQLSVAITKALYNKKDNTMTTKAFPSELIYCLSPTRNITESLRTFGTEETDTDFVLVGEEALVQSLRDSIHGELADISEVSKLTDLEAVVALYQIPREELMTSSLADSVITRMSSKDYNL